MEQTRTGGKMDKKLEQELKQAIERNLPSQVGETLQLELKELERLRRDKFEERALQAESKVRLAEQEKKELEKREELLKVRELALIKKEQQLFLDTQINELKLSYEQKISGAYNEMNKRILGNRTIRENVQNFGVNPLITTTETEEQ